MCLVSLHYYTGPGMKPASHGSKRKAALGYCLCFSKFRTINGLWVTPGNKEMSKGLKMRMHSDSSVARCRYRRQRNRQRSSGFLLLGRAPFVHFPLYKVMVWKTPQQRPKVWSGETLSWSGLLRGA